MKTTAATPTYKFKVQEKKGIGAVFTLEFDSQPNHPTNHRGVGGTYPGAGLGLCVLGWWLCGLLLGDVYKSMVFGAGCLFWVFGFFGVALNWQVHLHNKLVSMCSYNP